MASARWRWNSKIVEASADTIFVFRGPSECPVQQNAHQPPCLHFDTISASTTSLKTFSLPRPPKETPLMLKRLDHFDLHFSLGEYDFHISNIVLERFERSIPLHSHSKNSYEIHYIPFGYGNASIEGASYDIVPNTLFITGPFIEHSQIPDSEDPMCEYCIYLKIGRCPAPSSSLAEKKLARIFRQTDFWFGQDSQDIHTLMKQLFFELEHRYTGYSIQAEILLKQLIIKLVRNYEGRMETNSCTDAPNLFDNKYLIIEECFLYEYRTLTLNALSAARDVEALRNPAPVTARLGLGIRQTERLLKLHYGKTFLQKKTEARMSAASILLQNPSLSVTQIAADTGYSCVEHFSASFKRYYGQSATAYRKQFSISP